MHSAIKCTQLPQIVKEPEISTPNPAFPEGDGFQLSDQPVLPNQAAARRNGAAAKTKPGEHDLLYLIARDPRSLFLYWDVNWTRLFAKVGLSPREVHVRIYGQDGAEEGTRAVNPFLDHAYLDVEEAGAGYHCELGCFEGNDWIGLVRSGRATTPEDRMSDEMSAQFATLPMHLSFQRMLESLRAQKPEPSGLAEQVGRLQEEARVLRSMSGADWDRMVAAAAGPSNGHHGHSDLKTLLEGNGKAAEPPTAEELAQWQRLGEQLGGSSWGGASDQTLGGSSAA